jgi:hypothetical protein
MWPLRICNNNKINPLKKSIHSYYYYYSTKITKRYLSTHNNTNNNSSGGSSSSTNTFHPHLHPRILERILDIDKARTLHPNDLEHVWLAHFGEKKNNCVPSTLLPQHAERIIERANKNPMYIFPLVKDKPINSSYLVMFSKYIPTHSQMMMTWLENVKTGKSDSPWYSMQIFRQIEPPSLVLTNFIPPLDRTDALDLNVQVIKAYLDDDYYENFVVTFNNQPNKFDFFAAFPHLKKPDGM